MAIRLYPETDDPRTLEKLAHVPEGTWERLEELEGQRPNEDGPCMTAWYERLFQDKDLHMLNCFKTFGWGRFTSEATKYRNEHFPENKYNGRTNDTVHVKALLEAMCIFDNVSSVYWE